MSGQKKNSWVKPRHKFIQYLIKLIMKPVCRIKYGAEMVECRDRRQMLIVFNHQTGYDQFFVACSFKLPIYFIASEDIFSMGFVSNIIRWAAAPIPIKKQAKDITAVKTAIKVVREGGSVALSPEGNRTFGGDLCRMKGTIAAMARKFKLPIACYRIEGGYGVQPRWADVVRKGRMKTYTSRIIEPEEYAQMTDEELMDAIVSEINVDEKAVKGEYRSPVLAEYLERAMYVCPDCSLSRFESRGDIIRCLKCGKEIRYMPNKQLKGVNCSFPFEYVQDWYHYQEDYINQLNLTEMDDELIYTETVDLYKVNLYKNKELIEKAVRLELKGGAVNIAFKDGSVREIPFSEASAITVLGKNLINIYLKDIIYQIKGDKRFNGLKFVHLYNRSRNIKEGRGNEQFLGL